MSCYQITGGRALEGRLTVQGAKNSALPILTAALLAPGTCVVRNCPRLSDVTATLAILARLGCQVQQEGNTAVVQAAQLTGCAVPGALMGELRSSILFLGALLARTGEAELSYPGGCPLGPRPIDLHLAALRALGAEIREEGGRLLARMGQRRRDPVIFLPLPSVGATENAMLAACACPGVTTIVGAAREPEIVDLQRFLRAMGADVSGAGEDVLTVRGGRTLHGAEYSVVGDRMAAATYLCAAGAAGGLVELEGAEPAHLTALLAALERSGCTLWTEPGRITLENREPLRGIPPVRTAPYPGFPTDAQAPLMAALAGGTGTTLFEENMFDSRYHHVDELRRMGAEIQVSGRAAVVTGAGRLHGAEVRAADLRGGAALAVAGLSAEGTTTLAGLEHLCRGYEDLDRNLAALGAEIRTIP